MVLFYIIWENVEKCFPMIWLNFLKKSINKDFRPYRKNTVKPKGLVEYTLVAVDSFSRFQFHHRDNLWRKWKNFLPRSGVGFITGTFFSSVQYTLNWDSLEHKESYQQQPILQHWNVRYILQFLQQ